ncbi:MAG: type II toxin-antitoxin system RelE/ParE family toxin [Betaproteobacteria bacterium]
MAWRVEFAKGAQKDLAKLDAVGRERVLRFLADRIAQSENPRTVGEALRGPVLGRYWKYRVGEYRLICDLQDGLLLVLVVRVGHRREIYR